MYDFKKDLEKLRKNLSKEQYSKKITLFDESPLENPVAESTPVEEEEQIIDLAPVDEEDTLTYKLQKRIDGLENELDVEGILKLPIAVLSTKDGFLIGCSSNISKHEGERISAFYSHIFNKEQKARERHGEEIDSLLYSFINTEMLERYDIRRLKRYACLTKTLKDAENIYLILLFDSKTDQKKLFGTIGKYAP